MKPPQFTECSVCGREFGSKSIVIHEPQCLQRLRRTEIAQQEQESSSSSSNKKHPRKKKKSSERKQDSQFSSPVSSLASSSPVIHYSPPQSFVLLTTTPSPKTKSSNYITSMEKFNLPRIPINNFPSSAPNSNRPSTAVLEKPRILNPDYIQYDMSLTRIDFTGMPLGTKDENLNLRRPQTQTMDNPSAAGRHGFILPTVVDVIPKPPERITTKLTEACSLLPSANITTTIDSSLGDLQKRTPAPAVEANPGTARGGAFHSTRTMDLQQYVHDNDSDLSGYPPETSSSSSQAFFDLPLELLPVRTPSATSTSSRTSSSPPPRRPASRKPLSPPVESLFAPPRHPFYFKLSQCDLEKPLRTIFHPEKMTANRESYGTHPDNFLTPRPSSNSTPAGPRRTPPIPHYSPPPTPVQPDYCQDQFLNSSSENELQHDIRSLPLLQDKQSEPQHEIAKQFQQFTQDIQRHYKYKGTTQDLELRNTKLWPVDAPVTPGNSVLPGYSLQPDHGSRTKDSLNWIGEPFMKPFTYYKTPFVKEDNNPDSESESYATPAGESQEELELDAGSETENNQESVICLANLNKEERIDPTPEEPHTPFNAWAKESRTGNGGNDDIKLLNIEQAPDGSLTSRTSSSFSEIIFDASSNQETVKCLQEEQSSTSGSEFSDTVQSPRSLISVRRNSSISQLERRECSSDTASGDKAAASKTKTIYNFFRRERHKETMTVRESGSDADDEDQESQFVGNPYSYSARKRNHQTLDHVLGRRISSTSSIFASRKSRDCSCANPAKPQLSSHILQEMYQDLLKKNEMKRSMTDDAEFTPNQAHTSEKLSLNSSLPGSNVFQSIATGTRFNFSSPEENLSQDGVELPPIFSIAPHRPSRQGSQPSFEKIPVITSSLGFKNLQMSGNSRDSVNLPQMPSKPPSSDQYSFSSVNLPSIHSLPNYVKPTSASYETLPSVNRWTSQKWGPESLPLKQHLPSSNDENSTICMDPQNLEFLLTSTSSSVLSETDLVLPLKDETLLVHIDPTKFELAPPSHSPELPKRPHTSIPESHIRPDADNSTRPLTATLTKSSRFQQVLPELLNSSMANFSAIPAKKSARTRPRTLCLSPNFAPPHIQQRPASSPASMSPTHDFTHRQHIFNPKQSSERIQSTVLQLPVSQLVHLSKLPLEAQVKLKKNEVLTNANRRFQNSRQKELLSSPYWNPLAETMSPSPKPKDYTQRYPKWFSLDPPWKPDRSQIPTRIRSSRSQFSPRPLRNQIPQPQSQPSSDRSHPVQSPRYRNPKPRGKRVHFSSPPPPSDQSLDTDTHANGHSFSDIDSSKGSEPEAKKTKLRVKVHGFDKNRGKLRVTIRNPPNSPYDSGNDETFIITGQDVTSSSSPSPADEERSRAKTQYLRRGYTQPPAPGKTDGPNYPKEQILNALEKLELLKDKIRNREFDRRKRGRDENTKRIFSSISMFIPPLEEDAEDEAIDLKIIVRRKNKDGSLPPLESVLKNFSTKWTYLIIDEQPLTHKSPNSYISTHASKETAQRTVDSKPLKITTSNQSSINSLSDAEAATRFLTCYICGQSVNVRDFMDHEEQCHHDLARRNANLHEDEKRILPEKPRGTITIQRWNDFAVSSLKLQSLFVHCPHCGMTFAADNIDDHNLHVQTCVNAPPPEITSTVTVGKLSPRITVEVANDAAGWVVPTIKELRMPRWSAREHNFLSDVKQSSNNLPKPVRQSNPASRADPTLA